MLPQRNIHVGQTFHSRREVVYCYLNFVDVPKSWGTLIPITTRASQITLESRFRLNLFDTVLAEIVQEAGDPSETSHRYPMRRVEAAHGYFKGT